MSIFFAQFIMVLFWSPGCNLSKRFCRKKLAPNEVDIEHSESLYQLLQYHALKAWLEEEKSTHEIKKQIFSNDYAIGNL